MTITPSDFAFVRDLVHRESAIVLPPGKEYLVTSRLMPIVRRRGDRDLASLLRELRAGRCRRLRAEVVAALATNETSFFRDAHPFEAIRTTVLPELVAARAEQRSLSLWSAAASSGQEAYSLAMLVSDVLSDRPGWSAEVLGTDLSEAMLDRARDGVYTPLEVARGLPPERLARHLEPYGTGYRVRQGLRDLVRTRPLNLAGPWPALPRMDVVLLRNVLIYFDVPTRRRVLARVRQVLAPDGYLFLGGAETTMDVDDGFDRVRVGEATAYRPRRPAGPR